MTKPRRPARSPATPHEPRRLNTADQAGSSHDAIALTDTEILRADLSNVTARRTETFRVVVRESRLTGIALPDSSLSDTLFEECRIDLASFGACRLERVTFEHCVLTGTDFLEARLDDVRFHGCDLSDADFRGARMAHCELRSCTLDDLIGVEALRGGSLEWSAIVGLAGPFAAALGIDVLE